MAGTSGCHEHERFQALMEDVVTNYYVMFVTSYNTLLTGKSQAPAYGYLAPLANLSQKAAVQKSPCYTFPVETVLERVKSLPQKPGVYLFHGPADVVVYVGKAINLKSRVSSYFHKSHSLSPSKQIMVQEISRLEHILVNSETEALLLESTLIKKYRPKYNVLLKDDKNFQYIKIALGQPFPDVSTVRKITLDGSRYFGPYTSGLSVRRTLRLLKRIFPYKSCPNDPDIPCFDHQLGRCLGHHTGPDSQERYRAIVKKLITFLEGETGGLVKELKRHMQSAARQHDFETAGRLRDRWQALEHILEEQTVISVRRESYDIVALARLDEVAVVTLFQIRQGKLMQRDNFILQHTKDLSNADTLCSFIEQYYAQSTNHPPELFLPEIIDPGVGQRLQMRLNKPERGLKRKLMRLAQENAEDHLQREKYRWLSDEGKARLGLQELARALNLDEPPKRIEMYDISNIQGQHAVGSMVVFENGQPKKTDYRKFTIRNTDIPDDMHRLAEVVRRRLSHLPIEQPAPHPDSEITIVADDSLQSHPPLPSEKSNYEGASHAPESPETSGKTETSGAWPKPDLIILDGGKPQLSVVTKTIPGLLEHIPVVALAKREEEIFTPGESTSTRLPKDSQELFLIQRIRDEAHRFAISFYRKKHSQAAIKSVLDEIPGLGPVSKKKLLATFGDVQGIRQANDEAIAKVIGEKETAILREYV